MKITDETLGKAREVFLQAFLDAPVGTAQNREDWMAVARASLEFWAPILLAEPTHDEVAGISEFGKEAYRNVCTMIFANRLRSLLAKPDPAIEAVRDCFKGWFGADWIKDNILLKNGFVNDELWRNIVAAIDAARAGQKEGK